MAASRLSLRTAPYSERKWPTEGKVILGQTTTQFRSDEPEAIVVYQAYHPRIGRHAAQHKRFSDAPGWLDGRMTWFKTNFLWMMYRSDWARSKNQECILAIWLRWSDFCAIAMEACPTSYQPERFPTREAWQAAMSSSEVRLQWDPDHAPSGAKHPTRRAIQIGVKNETQRRWASGEMFLDVQDITPFVTEQRENVGAARSEHLQVADETEINIRALRPDVAAHLAVTCPSDAPSA